MTTLLKLSKDNERYHLAMTWQNQQNVGVHPVWSESLMCAHWVAKYPSFLMRTAKTDQTGQMPRLIWVFAGRTAILLVLSCHHSITFAIWHVAISLDSIIKSESYIKDRYVFVNMSHMTKAHTYVLPRVNKVAEKKENLMFMLLSLSPLPLTIWAALW